MAAELQSGPGPIAKMPHAAAKLLLVLIQRGNGHHKVAELQAEAGIPDWRTFRNARTILTDSGLWDDLYGEVHYPVASTPVPPVANTPVPPVTPVEPVPDTGMRLWVGTTTPDGGPSPMVAWPPAVAATAPCPPFALPRVRANPLVAEVIHPTTADDVSMYAGHPSLSGSPEETGLGLPGGEGIFPPRESITLAPWTEDVNHRAACMQADLLPADGDRMRPTSAFQQRRNTQLKAIQDAWKTLFHDKGTAAEISRDGAKGLLIAAGDSAEDVYDAMETTQARKVEYPKGYIEKMLRNRAQEASVKPVAIGTPEGVAEDTEYYRPMPAAHKARMEELQRTHPELFVEDDDDDA